MNKNTERTKFQENLFKRNNSQVKVISEEKRCPRCGKSESEIREAIEMLYCQGEIDEIRKDLFDVITRSVLPYWEEGEIAYADATEEYEAQGFNDQLEYMVSKYGKEKGTYLFDGYWDHHQYRSSCECQLCLRLEDP
jgi:hypothetical protein